MSHKVTMLHRLLGIAVAFGLTHPLPGSDCVTTDLVLNPQLLNGCRYELEMRRAGGPDPERIAALLRAGAKTDDQWGPRLLEACGAQLVRCEEFLPAAMERAEREKRYPEAARHLLRRVTEEATLQSLTVRQRRDLYARAMARGYVQERGISLDGGNAALRALGERDLELIPTIERALASTNTGSERIHRELAIAKALRSATPGRSLLSLVRGGVATRPDSSPEISAKRALQELRRLNEPGTVEDLKELFLLPNPTNKERSDLVKGTREEPPPSAHQRTRPNEQINGLRKEIARAIGDLGDHEFERKVLGTTLRDTLDRTERELVRRGKLASEALTLR